MSINIPQSGGNVMPNPITVPNDKQKQEKINNYLLGQLKIPGVKEVYDKINNDLLVLKEIIQESNKEKLEEMRTEYELYILRQEVLQSLPENQVRYQTESFFQNRSKEQPGALRENGPSAKDINRKRLGDHGRTGKDLLDKESAERNVALLQTIQNNSEQFKQDFIEVQGDGKTYRENHNDNISRLWPTEDIEFPST